jgi:hypothetical protein
VALQNEERHFGVLAAESESVVMLFCSSMRLTPSFICKALLLLLMAVVWWVLRVVPVASAASEKTPAFQTTLAASGPEARGTGSAEAASQDGLAQASANRIQMLDAADLLRELGGLNTLELGSNGGQLLIRRLASESPSQAVEFITRVTDAAARLALLQSTMLSWSEKDMDGVLKWVWSLPQGNERDQLLLKLAAELKRENPTAAIELVASLPASPGADEVAIGAAAQWAVTDPLAALAWALEIPESSLREQALAQIALSWSERDPLAAAAMAVAELSPGRLQEDAALGIVQRWVQTDAHGAAEWVRSFGPGPLADAALESLLPIWSSRDAEMARAWIRGLPRGAFRNQALSVYTAMGALGG